MVRPPSHRHRRPDHATPTPKPRRPPHRKAHGHSRLPPPARRQDTRQQPPSNLLRRNLCRGQRANRRVPGRSHTHHGRRTIREIVHQHRMPQPTTHRTLQGMIDRAISRIRPRPTRTPAAGVPTVSPQITRAQWVIRRRHGRLGHVNWTMWRIPPTRPRWRMRYGTRGVNTLYTPTRGQRLWKPHQRRWVGGCGAFQQLPRLLTVGFVPVPGGSDSLSTAASRRVAGRHDRQGDR